jgi:hypothetical protein
MNFSAVTIGSVEGSKASNEFIIKKANRSFNDLIISCNAVDSEIKP